MFWFWFNLIVHILMFLVDVAWWVVAFRLTRNRLWRVLISAFMTVQIIAFVTLHGPLSWAAASPKTFLVAVVVWHNLALGFGLLAIFILALRHLGKRVHRKVVKKADAQPTPPAAAVVPTGPIARREFLGACIAAAPAILTVGFTGLAMHQLSNFRLRRLTLSLPTLPRQLDGLTITHLSDIHVGRMTCGNILRNMVNTANDLRSDLVLLTGDLINYELSDLSGSFDLVRAMQGRYGNCMIEGNHDLIENAPEFRKRAKASGIPYLLNEAASITVRGYPVQLFGLKWSYAHGVKLDGIISGELSELMKQRNPDAFPIFLAHHPHAFDAAVQENLPLTLSGHTHGGQLMFNNRYGAGSALFRYWSGLYQRDRSQMVVSNGVGNMFPIRVNAPAEIVHLTLRCADARG